MKRHLPTITIVLSLLLLTSCASTASVFVPDIPEDWEYSECPNDWSEDLAKCNLSLPTKFPLEAAADDLDYVFTSFYDDNGNIATLFIEHVYYGDQFTVDELLSCQHMNTEACDISVRYEASLPDYSISAFILSNKPDSYSYYLDTGSDLFLARTEASAETIHLIDTSLLNGRVTKSVE
jgi:hypothetical protein